MLIISNMGDHVWLMTSRQTDPDLRFSFQFPHFRPDPSNLDVEFHSQLIDIGVEDAVDESDAGRLVRVGVGELDVDFPNATLERSCQVSADTPS